VFDARSENTRGDHDLHRRCAGRGHDARHVVDELRTPLDALLGWIHVLKYTQPAPGTAAQALDHIAASAHA
jgi:signal transduction histidine kinase